MENASKALIIAGAILLSILIISLGIMIFSQASGVINNNAMSELEVQQFNQRFTQYEGTSVRGANVNSMLQAVLSNNVSQEGDRTIEVSIDNKTSITKTGTSIAVQAVNGNTYTVTCAYASTGANKGLINKITVKKNT